jgi:hypothetical protein
MSFSKGLCPRAKVLPDRRLGGVAEFFLVLSLSKEGLPNQRWKAKAFRYRASGG